MKISLIQLGCPKNIVDGEWVLNQIVNAGNVLVSYNEAECVLINTCGFIEDAKKESLDFIAQCVKDKIEGKIKKIVVFGCLSERYRDELLKGFPEVDGFFPLSAIKNAMRMLSESGEKFKKGNLPLPQNYYRKIRFTPSHYAYLKIGDGCNHKCSFCAIPSIRGKEKWRNLSSVVRELKSLKNEGVKEAIIVAQDTTSYHSGENSIVDLINLIEKSECPKWVRLMYLYPTKVTNKFLEAMKNSSKIIPYFDIPLQHISKKVLSSMGRTGSFSSYINLVEKIRKSFKDSCLRSTFIVGFPTETKDDFNELKEFLKDAELDNVGFFKYSKEEGTRSFSYKDEMSEEEKEERLSEVADLQRKISLKRNKAKIGKKYEVLVDGLYEESDLLCEGRAFFQSPEIDGKIILNKGEFKIGEFHTVKITRAFEYDLVGELCASNKV